LLLDAGSKDHSIWSEILGDRTVRQKLTAEHFKFRCEMGSCGAIPHFHFHLAYEIANRWMQIESYKIYDDYSNFLEAQSVPYKKYKKSLYINLMNKKLRPLVVKGPLKDISVNWHKNYVNKGIIESSIYKYEVQGSTNTTSNVVTVGSAYSSFNHMIETMHGWKSVKVKDMWLDSRDTLNQQNILQITNVINEMDLNDKVLADLNAWVLNKLKQIDLASKETLGDL
jgi:hypothetical protein